MTARERDPAIVEQIEREAIRDEVTRRDPRHLVVEERAQRVSLAEVDRVGRAWRITTMTLRMAFQSGRRNLLSVAGG